MKTINMHCGPWSPDPGSLYNACADRNTVMQSLHWTAPAPASLRFPSKRSSLAPCLQDPNSSHHEEFKAKLPNHVTLPSQLLMEALNEHVSGMADAPSLACESWDYKD